MITLSLSSFITYYIFQFIMITIVLAAINAIHNKIGLKLAAFKLKKYEWVLIAIYPAIDFFIKVLLSGVVAFIFCIIVFLILYIYIDSKCP